MNLNKFWSQYWAQGHKTSFGNHFSKGYEGKLKEEWLAIFANINSSSKVLDLCTGNASIIRLAQENMANFSETFFTGVDYADIKVEDEVSRAENVNLLFNVNVSNLPLSDMHYHCIISNFGVEYSDINQSLKEVSRLLLPGGCFEFICHHEDSQLIKTSTAEIKLLNAIFEPSAAFECLEKLIVELKSVNNGGDNSNAELCRSRLNNCLTLLTNKYSDDFYHSDFVSFLKYILNPKITEKQAELVSFKRELLGYKQRLQQMVDVALTPEKISSLVELCSDLQLMDCRYNMVEDENGIIGCRVCAIKS